MTHNPVEKMQVVVNPSVIPADAIMLVFGVMNVVPHALTAVGVGGGSEPSLD